MLLQQLAHCYKLHEDDMNDIILDKFFDHRRGHSDMVTFLTDFRLKFDEANAKAGLEINDSGLTHLMFKWSGLPAKRIADIKLHFGGDTKRYDEMFAMLMRISKQEQADAMGAPLLQKSYWEESNEDVVGNTQPELSDETWCNAVEHLKQLDNDAWYTDEWDDLYYKNPETEN